MRSMTGFGRGLVERNGVRVVAEIRALNQRFLEVKLNLPRGWGEYEAEVRKTIQNIVSRGRVEIFIRVVTLHAPQARLEVNEKLAGEYVAELRKLGNRFDLNGSPGIEAILNRPESFHVVEEERDFSDGIELGMLAIRKALKALDAERAREGKSLRRDFAGRIAKIRKAIPRIEKLAEETRAEIMRNFETRIRELLVNLPVNEKRLYEEASSASQHGDISEEITRL